MDCPSEEQLIRLNLSNNEKVHSLAFDLENRSLVVFHEGDYQTILHSLEELNLGTGYTSSEKTDEEFYTEQGQKKILLTVLFINFFFFLLEITFGLISHSMGLVADSLDMLADSFVYMISLIAIGRALSFKKKVATTAGVFQITLAIIGFIEVLRRFLFGGDMPDFRTMIIVSIFALLANALCLFLLQKSRSTEAHMKASMIFTSNDIIINLGVIVAGVLVLLLKSNMPDLIIGTIVFILVSQGAYRILKLGK